MHFASTSIQEFEIDLVAQLGALQSYSYQGQVCPFKLSQNPGLPTEVGTQHLNILHLGMEEAREVVLE